MAPRWYFVTLCMASCLWRSALAQENPSTAQFASAHKAKLLAQAREQLRANHPQAALDAYRQAFQFAAESSPAEAQALLAEMRSLREVFAAADQFRALNQRLADPDDAAARTDLIRLLIRQRADFQAAEQLIDDTVQSDLRRHVELALRRPEALSPAEAIALAEWLQVQARSAIAAAQPELLARSLACYRRAAQTPPTDSSAARALLHATTDTAQRLADIAPLTGPVLPQGQWVDLTDLIDVDPSGPHWYREDGSLLHASGTRDSFTIPFRIDGNYDLQICFIQRGETPMLSLWAPFGRHRTGLSINNRGRDGLNIQPSRPSAIRDNQPRVLRLIVRPDGSPPATTFELDGLPYMRSNRPGLLTAKDESKPDGLAVTASHYVNFTWVGLRPVDGPAALPAGNPYWRLVRQGAVPARKAWQWAGQVRRGDILRIDATGAWSWDGQSTCGPSGDENGWHGLVGRFGKDGKLFPIGDGGWFLADRDGVLSMQMEDTDRSDNTGQVEITIRTFDVDPTREGAPVSMPMPPTAVAPSAAPAEDMRLLVAEDDLRPPDQYPPDRARALAEFFLAAAGALNEPALQIALAQRALDLGQTHNHAGAVTGALALLIRIDPTRAEKWQHRRGSACRAIQPPSRPDADLLVDALTDSGNNALRRRRFSEAAEAFGAAKELTDDAGLSAALAALAREAADLAALQSQRSGLLGQLAQTPDDTSARTTLIGLTMGDLDIPGEAAALAHPSLPADWQASLALCEVDPAHLDPQQCRQLARWCEALAAHAGPRGQSVLLAKAIAYHAASMWPWNITEPQAKRAQADIGRLIALAAGRDLPGYGPYVRGAWIDLLDLVRPYQLRPGMQQRHDGAIALTPMKEAPAAIRLPIWPIGPYQLRMQLQFAGNPGAFTITFPDVDRHRRTLTLTPGPGSAGTISQSDVIDLHITVPADAADPEVALAPTNGWTWSLTEQKDQASPLGPPIWIMSTRTPMVIRQVGLRTPHGWAIPLLPPMPARRMSLRLPAAQDWRATLDVRQGDDIQVSAEGLWTPLPGRGQSTAVDAEGLTLKATGETIGYLEGRIGDGEPFKIGADLRFTAETSGPLLLRMHDENRTDNLGALDVDIRILKRLPPADQP